MNIKLYNLELYLCKYNPACAKFSIMHKYNDLIHNAHES